MNNSSLGWKIFGILVSIAMIWGGLSGEFVLRGTNNSTALVVAGFVFLIWDIISIVTHKKQSDEIEEVEVPQPKVDGLVANNHSAQREPGKATYAMPPVPNAAPPAKQAYSPVDAESSIDFATPEIAVDASSESASVVERNLLAELEQEVEVTPSVEPAPAVVHIPVS
ncbi:MAG: hypothetical protein LBE56_06060, partial [Tannerella sp.]|nr:hypothetical protein [Tannerella sp.]